MRRAASLGGLLLGLLGLLGLLAAAGCGGDEPAPDAAATFVRLDLRPAAGAPAWPVPEVVQSLDVMDASRWTAEAPLSRKGTLRLPGGLAVDGLLMECKDRQSPMILRASGPFDPAAFQEVRLLVTSAAPGLVQARFLRGRTSVWSGPAQPLVVGSEASLVEVPLPPVPDGAQAFDTFELLFEGSARRIVARNVELVRRPLASRLPDPSRGSVLFEVAGDGRRGVGLSALRPVETVLRVPSGARLEFAYARPWQVAQPGRQPSLRVEVTPSGGETSSSGGDDTARADEPSFVEVFDLDEATWSTARLELSDFAGRDVRVRVSIDDETGRDAAGLLAEACVWSPGRAPPSVLLVTSDTHRADHLGAAQSGIDVETPVLDALAEQGVLFTDCFSLANVTNPSHIAIMTGVHPRDTGIDRNNQPLAPAAATLAEAFADAGYATLAVVSARHLGDPSSGLGQGFDRMVWPLGTTPHAADTVALARSALDEIGDRPVFLWLHVFDAHTPYEPPEEHREAYWPDERDPYDHSLPVPDLPAEVLADHFAGVRDLDFPRAMYRAEVTSLDAALGEVLAEPRFARGIVAVTADHGESLGQHGIWFTHAGLFPDSIHVPLILRWPDGPAGVRVTAPVSHADLAATLLDLARVPSPIAGRSLLDALDGGWREEPRFSLSANGFSAAVTYRNMHLMLWLRAQSQRQMSEFFDLHEVRLYDLAADPECTHDLVSERFDEAAAMRRSLIDWLAARVDLGWSGASVDDPTLLENLEQLGYVASSEAPGPTLWVEDGCDRCRVFDAPAR